MQKSDGSESNSHLLRKETIESDELLFNPGWFPSAETTIFPLKSDAKKGSTGDPNYIGFVFISADEDVVYHSKAIYNFLDFLGDIGGLRDALKLIGSFLVSVFC